MKTSDVDLIWLALSVEWPSSQSKAVYSTEGTDLLTIHAPLMVFMYTKFPPLITQVVWIYL